MTETISPLVRRVLAPNAGPMTLDGTNSYLIGADPAEMGCVVVDPGPLDDEHLRALAADPVALILLTHHHPDHVDGVRALVDLTGAPVRAIDPKWCIGADPLSDCELIEAAGAQIHVIATPGHTADSACFLLPEDGRAQRPVLTGDTILGRGTTIIADPDGALGPYLASLERLRRLGPATVLPGHGPVLPDLAAICDDYLAHRAARLDEIRSALRHLGAGATVEAVTDLVYSDSDAAVRPAAEASVRAQLLYIRSTEA